MKSDRLKVTLTCRLPEAVERRMKELFDLRPRDQDQPMERSELIASMKSCDVLVPCINDTIDNAMLSQAGPNLRLIANFAAGFDNIDVATALQKNILVSNTPGVVTEDTADMAMALILGVTRRIPEGLNVMKEDVGQAGHLMLFGRAHFRPTFGYFGHGAHRARTRRPRQCLWHAGALSQSQTLAPRTGRTTQSHLLGKSRSNGGPYGYRVNQLPPYPVHLSLDERASIKIDEKHGCSDQHITGRSR